VEIVNVRIAATTPPPWTGDVVPAAAESATSPPVAEAFRPVLWSEQGGFAETPVFLRSRLPIGYRLPGPAILEQFDTTVVLPPGSSATADRFGNLVIEAGEADEGVC
jgi:N-methylhydantoinase A